MMSARHFLSLLDCTPAELSSLIRRGVELKALRNRGGLFEPLKNRVLGMIFEKASTRTRLSFEAGMIQLGGQAIFLSPRDTQLGRGEPIGDTAIVLATHGIELAERLLTRVCVLRDGRIGADFDRGRLDAIRADPAQSVEALLVAAMHGD